MTAEHLVELLFGDLLAYMNRFLDWVKKNIFHQD